MSRAPEPPESYVLSRAEPEPNSGCWLWTGAMNLRTGYGVAYDSRPDRHRSTPAHRLSYEVLRDDVPNGLEIDHLCRNRRCVNPWHMEAVTRRVNLLRGNTMWGINARKTHCPRGHPFDGTGYTSNGRFHRRCHICHNAVQVIRMREYRERLRAR